MTETAPARVGDTLTEEKRAPDGAAGLTARPAGPLRGVATAPAGGLLGSVLAHDVELLGGEHAAPFGVGVGDGVRLLHEGPPFAASM